MRDYRELNAHAWDHECATGNWWTRGCSPGQVEEARAGILDMTLTPCRRVRQSWVVPFIGREVLCLASGGGQQAILFAAAGCAVTDLDISPSQLEQDRKMANLYGLTVRTDLGDMQDLSRYGDESFDLVFNPSSTCFVADVEKVYRECFRVLRRGGVLCTAAINPALYMFDEGKLLHNKVKVRYTIPYSDTRSLSEKEKRKMERNRDTFEFSHTVDSLIGGLCRAGFVIEEFETDESGNMACDSYLHDCFFGIKARKQ